MPWWLNMNLDELTAGLPKTELTYMREMSLKRADANVLKIVPDKGSHAYLVLDKTIFHPKGGGQPSDHGSMNGQGFVANVKKAIFHRGVIALWVKVTEGTAQLGPVTCEVDWAYRYLMMRRHTAAHLLDHCLARVTASTVQTTDSWLDEPCYVGYAGKAPNPETLVAIEALANALIQAGGAVAIKSLTAEEARSSLEEAPNFERLPELEEVRIVQIAGCEPIPCGGTHVSDIREIRKMTVPRAEQVDPKAFRLHFSVER
jgi:alanyl-tRNA synthetase